MSPLPDIERIAQGASVLSAQATPELLEARKNRSTFCWRNVQMHPIQRQCYILTNFMLVIFMWFCQVLTFFIQGTKSASASRERKLNFQFLTYVSSSVGRIRTVGLIPYNLQEMTSCIYFIHPPKFMQIELTCSGLLISVHDDRQLSADGFITMGPIAMKFYVKNETSQW